MNFDIWDLAFKQFPKISRFKPSNFAFGSVIKVFQRLQV